MFDRIEFDKKNELERQRQLDSLQKRLYETIVAHSNIRDVSICPLPTKEEREEFEKIDIPEIGRNAVEVEEELMKYVFTKQAVTQHPRFFSFVASAVSPYSIAGSILTDIYNANAGSYELNPCGSRIEEKLCTWMGSLAGYPKETSSGVFLSGGSISTMSAFIAARVNKLGEFNMPKGVAYLSDQAHSSVKKALRMLGFRNDHVVILKTDDDFKMDVKLLEEAIKNDLRAGKIPFLVVGTLGTTNTGTIDPLDEIGDVAKKYNLWFHVDGAFGASSLISNTHRLESKGIEKSDSLTWDTHKWLMQTYSCSTLIVKDKKTLVAAFVEHPEYLDDITSTDHLDGWDKGPEMSKPNRAIKLWFTIQATGTKLLEEMVDYSFDNAYLVESELKKLENWEIVSKPSCGVINFRYVPKGLSDDEINQLNLDISNGINNSGYAYIVTTTLKGKKSLRMCMINANSTEEDIINTIYSLNQIAIKLSNKVYIKDVKIYKENEMVDVLHTKYKIIKLLGHGKGGYSYLVHDENNKPFVLKQIHHEPCDYYNFGNKIEAEQNDYNILKKAGIRVPNMISIDKKKEIVIKDYIDGNTIFELIKDKKSVDIYLDQIKEMASKAKLEGINIDYFPTNFVVQDELLWYIDFECNDYMEQWNFDNWGIKYWSWTKEFKDYLNKIEK